MTLYIACDHAGVELKDTLKEHFNTSDLGCHAGEACDYPDSAAKLCMSIKEESDRGILICGSGIGISIAANRFKHIRAALCMNNEMVILARKHNNANVLCLGARLLSATVVLEMVQTFLRQDFLYEERHIRRIQKLTCLG